MAENTIVWSELKAHLLKSLEQVRSQQDTAVGDENLRLQGEVRRIKKLLNLPETMAFVAQEDQRVLDEERGKKNGKGSNE